MPPARRRITVVPMSTRPAPLPASAAALAADLAGLATAVARDRDSLGHAITAGTAINAPLPFIVVQSLAVAAVAMTRSRIAAGVLAFLCGISVFSGFSDGSYGHDGLSAAEVALQMTIVAATAGLGALALSRTVRPARH